MEEKDTLDVLKTMAMKNQFDEEEKGEMRGEAAGCGSTGVSRPDPRGKEIERKLTNSRLAYRLTVHTIIRYHSSVFILSCGRKIRAR